MLPLFSSNTELQSSKQQKQNGMDDGKLESELIKA